MNKTLVVAGVALVAVAGAAWYIFGSNATSTPGGEEAAAGETSETANGSTLAALMAAGTPQRCTFTDSTDAAQTSGTVYVANGKMRGDFTASASSGTTEQVHSISDGTTVYTWMDGMTTGFKTAVAAQAGSGNNSNPGIDPTKTLDYHCEPWTADASLFATPSGVTFTDLNALIQGQIPALPQ